MTKRNIIIFALILCAFSLGYETRDKEVFPIGRFIKRTFDTPTVTPKQMEVRVYDKVTRKEEVQCPKQEDAVVILGFGQSNGANYAGHRFESASNILNFFNGKCYIASDPMLGATGVGGSIWIPLSEQLNAAGKQVVLITFGVGSSRASHWLDANKLLPFYNDNVNAIKERYPHPDYAVWIQGEADRGRYAASYETHLHQLFTKFKSDFPETNILLTPTTYCREPDPAVVEAQKNVADKIGATFIGGADQLTNKAYRYDDCHFSEQGIRKLSSLIAAGFKK